MTQYTAFVADKELHEVDFTGFRLTTVRELKKMYALSDGFPEQPWHSFDDDVELLNAPDENALQKLRISKWEQPPYDLEDYSDKAFVYSVMGSWRDSFLSDLLNYIKQHITAELNVELIRFWAGEYDDLQQLKERIIVIDEIEIENLGQISQENNIRIKFL